MKKYLFSILAAIAFLMGCDGPGTGEVMGEIQLSSSSKDIVEIDADGSRESIRFSSALDWNIELSADWLTVDPMEGGPGPARVSFSADANETQEVRQTVVNICSGTVKFPITVTQEPFIPTFDLLDTEDEISCLGGEVVVRVYTDVDYSYECQSDWVKGPDTKAARTRQVVFTVEPNTLPETRTTLITFCAGTVCKAFTLTQRAAGTEADDWKKDPFRHRSLAMRFTATWCGYCPMMGTAFDSAKSQMSGALELVSLHGGQSDLEFSGTNTLINRFNVSGFPTGIVDARASIPNYQTTDQTATATMDVAKETQEEYPAKSAITCSSSLSGTSLSVDLSLYFKEADTYRVTVLLLEDGITGAQNGVSGTYVHNDVARKAITSMNGEEIVIAEDFQQWTKSYTLDINSKWKSENLEILVYVEKPYGDQTVVKGVKDASYGKYGDTYIDNCRVVKVGETAELELR